MFCHSRLLNCCMHKKPVPDSEGKCAKRRQSVQETNKCDTSKLLLLDGRECRG